MNFSEQISEGITVDRVPDACYDCGNVIPHGGHRVYGRLLCHRCTTRELNKHCAGLPLDDAAQIIREMAKC